jgi:protein-tyrosine-phosphatase
MKVTDVLMNHAIPCEEQVSKEFDIGEVDDTTLVLTMNFTEKVKLVEDFELAENIYTIKEFVEEEGDVTDPYGGEEGAYEECYVELKDLLYKVKKKLEWS